MKENEHVFVTKDRAKNIRLLIIILVAACVILAIISLLPGRRVNDWLSTDYGVARYSMFPFVFTSENSLYVMDKELNIYEIDDTVSECTHDSNFDLVYYLRNNVLYEYDIGTNSRIPLSEGVTKYMLFEERASIVCMNLANDVYLYSYKSKSSVKMNSSELSALEIETPVLMGKKHVLFIDNYNEEASTADLMVADTEGNVDCICKEIDVSKNYYISESDEYVCFYKDNQLIVKEIGGEQKGAFENAKLITETVRPVLHGTVTGSESYYDEVIFDYFLTDISESGDNGNLIYFNGKKQNQVDTDVKSVVHHSDEDYLVIYTKDNGDGNYTVYKSVKGKESTELTVCSSTDSLFFDDKLNFLYMCSADGVLRRINVNDKNYTVTEISDCAGTIYDYTNKSFVGYTDTDGKIQYLILSDNSVEKYSMSEIRLYGKYDDRYLMCRESDTGVLSLDYCINGSFTRISGNVSANIYFDREFDNVIYCSDNKMYLWCDGEITKIGDYAGVSAISMIS